MENIRIGIVGNIGVGKSTLSEAMQRSPLSNILLSALANTDDDEKVYTFPESFDPHVLDAFYKQPKKLAFVAQIEFLNGRLRRQHQIEQARGIVLEDRTIFEDYHIFGKAQKILGHMSEAEFISYQNNYELMCEKIHEPDLVVYLRANVDTLIDRICKRGRDSEKSISRDYLELLNNLYETFISKFVKCPVLVINCNNTSHTAEDLNENFIKIARQIVDKIRELDLRISTPGIKEWITLPETEGTLRAIEAECILEKYLKNNHKLITVAGNVGLGKSTVTALMHQSLRIKALYETPEKNPLLSKFLNNKRDYCYKLQKHFLQIRAEQRLKGKQDDCSYVKDRSLPEDILVFCQQFHQDGFLSSSELDLLSTEFREVNRTLPQSDLMIVLQGKPELAWQRIQLRGRKMELNGGWSLREIRSLSKLYKTYPEDVLKCGYHTNPILKINVNKLDLTNRLHMGYLFEKTYEALQQT